ncbi:MAG: glycosyltransferase [Kiritimatiellae bacterium]|nr:glycosyltransferase [Kiritimatiellia bacterium]
MPILHQLVAGFRRGDAISNEALLIRDLCAAHGLESDIFCPVQNAFPADRGLTKDVETLSAGIRPDDVALLHLSIGSRCNRIFPSLPCRKVVLYHNVTPPRFFERLNPSTAQILADGLAQVAELKDAADAVWADSAFNASELRAMGYRDPKVFPLLVDESFGTGTVHEGMRRTLSDPPLANVLFVGRLAPNKRHDRLLQVFSAFQRYVEPKSRLVVAGGSGGAEAYKALLLGSVYTLVAKNVLFTDFVDDAKLRACYATASAFVCMSDHEGFCAPLLEAMAWHVPVFANAAGAVPETLDGAGVLVRPEDPPELVAETMGRVLGDPALRAAVVKKQDERLARFRARDAWAELREVIGV